MTRSDRILKRGPEPSGTGPALVDLCARPVPPEARDRAAVLLGDWLGCAFAARPEPVTGMLAGWARDTGPGRAFAMGTGSRTAETAAFVNGGLGNVLEMDDLHRGALLHAGDTVLPAALATAQDLHAAPEALLDGIVTGYEAAIRIGQAAAATGYAPWVNSATCGVFGAAIAAATVRGLDRAGHRDALGLAGMQAGGLWQCRLDPGEGKQLATAHAARAGVTAAALAACGMAGPERMLDGPLGFLPSFYPGADPATITADPTGPWRLHEVSLKPWPACRHTHPAIAAALSLRTEADADAIAGIEVHSYRAALEFCDAPAPDSAHAARFSLQHCVAVALLRGAPGLDDMAAAARRDPGLDRLREKVTLIEDPGMTAAFPTAFRARLRLTHADGNSVEAHCDTAPGDPEAPLGAAEIAAKRATNLRRAGVTAAAATRLTDALHRLPHSQSLNALNDALSACNPEIPCPTI